MGAETWVAWAENDDGSRYPVEVRHAVELDRGEEFDNGPGIYRELGTLPMGTVINEDGLAIIMGKQCRESIKRAVARGELPQPVKIMGQNCWTVGAIIRHIEERLDSEGRRMIRLKPSA